MGIKVSIIGAGSSYTPELIEGFIESWDELPVNKISLMDINDHRLGIIAGLTERMVQAGGVEIDVESTLDQRRSIDGADFVVSQIRVGGMDARILDENIPPLFGVIGQETTGPGGFAKALRTIPVALRIARDMESLAPGATLLNFTNPAGLITEALCRYSTIPTIGLCNLPIGTEMRLAKKFEVDRKDLQLDWVGLNHLNWTRRVYLKGEDIWSEVFVGELEEARGREPNGWDFSEDLLQAVGMIPCGYLNYYYNHDRMLAKQQAAPRTRGEEVKEIESKLLDMYRDPDLKKKPELLEKRGGAYYSKAAVSLISALANDKQEIHIVNTVNQGAIPELSPDVVIEVSCRVGSTGAEPIPVGMLPPQVRGLIQAVKTYEEMAAIAGVEGDRRQALLALLAHPLTPSFTAAQGLLEALLDAHRAYLPQFFPSG